MGTRGCLAYGEWALVAVLIATSPKPPSRLALDLLPHPEHISPPQDGLAPNMIALTSSFAFGSVVTPPTKIIMKFGGSSVRDAERVTEVCKLVQMQIDNGLCGRLKWIGGCTDPVSLIAPFASRCARHGAAPRVLCHGLHHQQSARCR